MKEIDELVERTKLTPEEIGEFREAIRLGFQSFENGTPIAQVKEDTLDDILFEVAQLAKCHRDRPDMTKEEASEIVKGAFGSRPDFPSGKDFVDEVRGHDKPDREKAIKDAILGVLWGDDFEVVGLSARMACEITDLLIPVITALFDGIRKQQDIVWIKAWMRGEIMVSKSEQLDGIGDRIRKDERAVVLAKIAERGFMDSYSNHFLNNADWQALKDGK